MGSSFLLFMKKFFLLFLAMSLLMGIGIFIPLAYN